MTYFRLQEVLKRSNGDYYPYGPDDTLRQCGLDELELVVAINELEDELGVVFDVESDDFNQDMTLRDFWHLLNSREVSKSS